MTIIYLFYLSAGATLLCVAVLCALKYISISKMRIDNRDKKKKILMSTVEVLTLLRSIKPFPVNIHKGWKLHSFHNNSRVWSQEVSSNSSDASLNVYAAYKKVRVSPQIILQILKDVSKTSSWKPCCLATSITYKPLESESSNRVKGIMGNMPVQHDIVMEETNLNLPEPSGVWQYILGLFGQNGTVQTITKENKRYWHREDNGVCWHLQMCEHHQQWLFFLAQPVEEVDECMLTVLGYQDSNDHHTSASYVSEVLGSLSDYILYRKVSVTPLIDIKLPSTKTEKTMRSYSSSEDTNYGQNPGRRMFLRFRSLVEKPTFGADKFYSVKRQLLRSASILRHKSRPLSDVINFSTSSSSSPNTPVKKAMSLKTNSLDRKQNMPKLSVWKDGSSEEGPGEIEESEKNVQNNYTGDTSVESSAFEQSGEQTENNNLVKDNGLRNDDDIETNNQVNIDAAEEENIDKTNTPEKDIDKILDEDVDDHEQYELLTSRESKDDIQHIVAANQIAAELLAVALQASNLDLSTSIEEQVANSGGWMFCGLDNDVVVLKKISVKENIQCYLGKGVIQAPPRTVWNAIKNPRTRFTYDDSLKKVDVLETINDTIKIVYYYHEVLQLFKTECCDMVVTQSERIDRGDKYVLAMQSSDKPGVTVPPATLRLKVLPSGWIIEPMNKDKKVHSMVTYIMQVDFCNLKSGLDKSTFGDLISKQPMSIAYLRQYLRGCSYLK